MNRDRAGSDGLSEAIFRLANEYQLGSPGRMCNIHAAMEQPMRSFSHLIFGSLVLLTCLGQGITQPALTKVYDFVNHDNPSQNAGLVEGPDQELYGWSAEAGTDRRSLLFRIHKDGSGYRVLHTFSGLAEDGESPTGLVYGSDNVLYGVAGDQDGLGRIFALAPDGSGYHVLKTFDLAADKTANPFGLMEASDGRLYGVTGTGSPLGTVFRINKDGGGFQVLHRFPTGAGDGQFPRGLIREAPDGRLYGVTASDRGTFLGTVYRINTDGSAYEVLHQFKGQGTGSLPDTGLLYASDGFLYGQVQSGGTNNAGGVFKLRPDGTEYQFIQGIAGGTQWYQGLAESSDGYLYGATSDGGPRFLGTLFRVRGAEVQTLHEFSDTASPPEGVRPKQLLHASDGFLYFITFERSPKPIAGLTVYKQYLMRYGPVPTMNQPARNGPALRARFVREGQSTQFKLAFAAEPGRDYEIQFTDLLPAHWQSAQTLPAGAEGTVEFTDEIVPGRAARYFRAVAK